MEEKILSGKKNGMAILMLSILLYILAVVLLALGCSGRFSPALIDENGVRLRDYSRFDPSAILIALSAAWLCLGWIIFLGLKILKPQEALVLTLFGKYVGSLKGEGFYFVNPFCSSINPAAKTKLNQSGDVDSGKSGGLGAMLTTAGTPAQQLEAANKKLSLKIMTLNNSRQKVNDCLGNPVEIGIAVMWRVVD
ncbi:MAG: SPFH domain-containing protein, partial [Oscillospiraceae bacterium]|nr:SPFH domain-containing protein [Oscillospiraceae bacterium]